MTAEHRPGITDYFLATMTKLGTRRGEGPGVAFTSPEQTANARKMRLTELATEIRTMRGDSPGIGMAIAEELAGAIKNRLGKGKQKESQKDFIADASSMEDSTL